MKKTYVIHEVVYIAARTQHTTKIVRPSKLTHAGLLRIIKAEINKHATSIERVSTWRGH